MLTFYLFIWFAKNLTKLVIIYILDALDAILPIHLWSFVLWRHSKRRTDNIGCFKMSAHCKTLYLSINVDLTVNMHFNLLYGVAR